VVVVEVEVEVDVVVGRVVDVEVEVVVGPVVDVEVVVARVVEVEEEVVVGPVVDVEVVVARVVEVEVEVVVGRVVVLVLAEVDVVELGLVEVVLLLLVPGVSTMATEQLTPSTCVPLWSTGSDTLQDVASTWNTQTLSPGQPPAGPLAVPSHGPISGPTTKGGVLSTSWGKCPGLQTGGLAKHLTGHCGVQFGPVPAPVQQANGVPAVVQALASPGMHVGPVPTPVQHAFGVPAPVQLAGLKGWQSASSLQTVPALAVPAGQEPNCLGSAALLQQPVTFLLRLQMFWARGTQLSKSTRRRSPLLMNSFADASPTVKKVASVSLTDASPPGCRIVSRLRTTLESPEPGTLASKIG